MNKKPEEFYNRIKDQTVAVVGVGISNKPLIRLLLQNGAKVRAYDKKTQDKMGDIYDELSKLGVEFVLGEHYLDSVEEDIIFKTPGVRYDEPALLEAKKRGAWITSEMEVFFDICPATIIAITGSDGKTTTTTLVNEFLTADGKKTWLGGNIGKPLLPDCDKISADDYVVVELSSFQLHTMTKSPHIAVITNLSPNHLDYHRGYQEYIDAKTNIFTHQSSDDVVVLNSGNADTIALKDKTVGNVRTFSAYTDADFALVDGKVMYKGETLLDIADIKIPGMHNVENYMAAMAATVDIVDSSAYEKVAKSFGGVPHRIELVRELDGVKYYNSSIDSSPSRTQNTLKVFGNNVVMIAGGKDKGIPFDAVGNAIKEHVKTLILIGMTSNLIEAAVEKVDKDGKVKIIHATSYEDAVKTAHDSAAAGDVVLLSPASTSFDLFDNFEQRGNLYKELVNKL